MTSGSSEAKFAADRTALMDGAEPSSGDNLLGMQIDCDAYFLMAEALDNVQVASTGDPENLLDVTATARPGVGDDEIAEALVRVWTQDLRYGYAESHVITEGLEGVILRAVTKIGPEGFYVTLTVSVARVGA